MATLAELLMRGQDSLLEKMMRIYRDFQARVAEHYAAQGYAGLSVAHTLALANLDEDGVRIVEIARRMNVTKQFAGRVVQELLARDFVTSAPDPHDQRALLIRGTAAGWDFLAFACATRDIVEQEYRALLGEPLFEHFAQAVKLLSQTITGSVPPTTFLE